MPPPTGQNSGKGQDGVLGGQVRFEYNNNQIIIDDANHRKVASLGVQPDGSIALKFFEINGIGKAQFGRFTNGGTALKVAASGIEVATATDAQLIFNSAQDIFKIVSTGTFTFGPDSTSSTNKSTVFSIAHGLGYVPIPMVFGVRFASGAYTPFPYFNSVGTTQRNFSTPNNGFVLALNQYLHAEADATNLTFYNDFANNNYPSGYSTQAVNIKWFLLQETAN